MKKKILLIGSILLAGISLSSCNQGEAEQIKAKIDNYKVDVPDKGNKVSSISLKYEFNKRTYSKNINDSMTFSEVVRSVAISDGNIYVYSKDNEKSCRRKYYESIDYYSENEYDVHRNFQKDVSGFLPKGKQEIKKEKFEFYDKYSYFTFTPEYPFNNDKEYLEMASFVTDNSIINENSVNEREATELKYAKEFEYTKDSNNVRTKKMKYSHYHSTDSTSESINENGKTSSSNKEKLSYFIKNSIESNTNSFSNVFVAYDERNQETVSYEMDSSYGLYNDTGTFNSFFSSTIYLDRYSELYDASYELTDKYIILRMNYDFTDEVLQEAESNAYKARNSLIDMTSEEYSAELKKLMDNDYKESKTSFELWIKYDDLGSGYTYFKKDQVTVYNIERVYDEAEFEYHVNHELYGQYNENSCSYETLLGKTLSRKGKKYISEEMNCEPESYTSKFEKAYNDARNNNYYKDLVFKPVIYS